MIKKIAWLCVFLLTTIAHADNSGEGQILQITTNFHAFVGRPQWLIMIRDLDHNQMIPYVYDIEKGTNAWLAISYSQHYVITASEMQFSPYHHQPFSSRKIHNFCHIESQGHILNGESLIIRVEGDLTPYSDTYRCYVTKVKDDPFSVAPSSDQ